MVGQSKFKERMMDPLDQELKGIMTVVSWQAQNLCQEFSTELQATQHNLKDMCWESKMQLAAAEV